MKHFITFQKSKGLFLSENIYDNRNLALQIQHQLFKHGYIMTNELFDVLCTQDDETLNNIYQDINNGLTRALGGADKYEIIYQSFPQSVKELSEAEFFFNAILHYWSGGTWRPEDEKYINKETKIEPVDFKVVSLINEKSFLSIFSNIVYSGNSISKWDKEIVDWFIDNTDVQLNLSKISFKETLSYVGQRLMENKNIEVLPTRNATDILRIYAAYSGGDEGLKENTRFVNLKRYQKRLLSNSLDNCYNLEDSFKTYREVWLKVLFYLNIGSLQKTHENLFYFGTELRNNPKNLRTFASYVEEAIQNKDEVVFELLKNRKGVFMRRLDHLVRIFGIRAFNEFIRLNPSMSQLVNIYNHFINRDKKQDRAVVLAGQSSSEVSTFEGLEPLPKNVVDYITSVTIDTIKDMVTTKNKVYIDPTLYSRPLALNNRASSFSIDGKTIGTVEKLPEGKTLRAYVRWQGKSDIDLTAMIIFDDNQVTKVGWNGTHNYQEKILYSGDNTGYSKFNAEYIDISLDSLKDENIEWIILDARVYSGKKYIKWAGEGVHTGWTFVKYPEANTSWLPQNIINASKIESDSKSAYLCAIHVESKSLVYLDVSSRNHPVTGPEDALKMKIFLNKFVQTENTDKISWKKINQGHILNLLSEEIVDNPNDADIVFDENTTWESISGYLNKEEF